MILYTVCDYDGNSYYGQAYDKKKDANKLLKALKESQPDKNWHIEKVEDTTR